MNEHKQTTKRIQGSKFIAPLLVLTIAALLLLPLFTRLTVRAQDSGRLILERQIRPHETFELRFTHSVNLSYVTDSLEWTGSELILRSSLFTSFGAGMPVLADDIGTEMHNTDDGFLITGIDKPQQNNQIPIMLQAVPDHHLLYRGEEISLREAADGTAFIKLGVERLSIASMLMK